MNTCTCDECCCKLLYCPIVLYKTILLCCAVLCCAVLDVLFYFCSCCWFLDILLFVLFFCFLPFRLLQLPIDRSIDLVTFSLVAAAGDDSARLKTPGHEVLTSSFGSLDQFLLDNPGKYTITVEDKDPSVLWMGSTVGLLQRLRTMLHSFPRRWEICPLNGSKILALWHMRVGGKAVCFRNYMALYEIVIIITIDGTAALARSALNFMSVYNIPVAL